MREEFYAYAKLNLCLDILGKRPDGYHELKMVMHSVTLHDTLCIKSAENGISCSSNLDYLPGNEENLAVKAAKVFFRETGVKEQGLRIRLNKLIPICAGMGGGSSDAAAVLRWLRQEFLPQLSLECLEQIAALVGSDVPYCVRGGTVLARGRGEILQDLPALPECFFVLCKPDFSISTPELFRQIRVKRILLHPDSEGMTRALEQGDLEGVARRMYNVFEDFLPRRCSEIFTIKHLLLQEGAMNAVMTGSGPTVFGIFDGMERAQKAYERIKQIYPAAYLAENVKQGV